MRKSSDRQPIGRNSHGTIRYMNLRLPLLLSNIAIWASFVWNTPLFYATKSVCVDYGLDNPIGCHGFLSSMVFACVILNHFLNAFVDEGRLHGCGVLLRLS